MWNWLADRLILSPSRHPISSESQRRLISWDQGQFEAFVQRTHPDRAAEVLILKFPGTGGRAERATVHPADCWDDHSAEIWAINPPGYGGSPGRARLANKMPVAEAAWNAIRDEAQGRPVIVTGNSLGSLAAFYLAASREVDGLVVRNPVPLREVILQRFGWPSRVIAHRVPDELCTISNASRTEVPAVIVSSQKDRIVPPNLQQQIISKYAGESAVVKLRDADHADLPSDEELGEYVEKLAWLRDAVLPGTRK